MNHSVPSLTTKMRRLGIVVGMGLALYSGSLHAQYEIVTASSNQQPIPAAQSVRNIPPANHLRPPLPQAPRNQEKGCLNAFIKLLGTYMDAGQTSPYLPYHARDLLRY